MLHDFIIKYVAKKYGIFVIREYVGTYHMITDSSSVPKLFTRTFCSETSKWQMCSAWSTEMPERKKIKDRKCKEI